MRILLIRCRFTRLRGPENRGRCGSSTAAVVRCRRSAGSRAGESSLLLYLPKRSGERASQPSRASGVCGLTRSIWRCRAASSSLLLDIPERAIGCRAHCPRGAPRVNLLCHPNRSNAKALPSSRERGRREGAWLGVSRRNGSNKSRSKNLVATVLTTRTNHITLARLQYTP